MRAGLTSTKRKLSIIHERRKALTSEQRQILELPKRVDRLDLTTFLL